MKSSKALRKEAPAPTRVTRPVGAPRIPGGVRQFIVDTKAELKRVVWPTRQQATNLTVVVIAVSAAVGLFMGGVDYVFRKIFELILGGG